MCPRFALAAPVLASIALAASPQARAGGLPEVRVESSMGGDGVRDLRAEGLIRAPPASVFRVLCDVRLLPELVPQLAAMTILEEDAGGALAYQRLELPALAPRDFTVRNVCAVRRSNGGRSQWTTRWRTDNGAGPPPVPGVVRVDVNEGSWTLEAIDGGDATRATYRVRIDPGGEVPPFVVHTALELQLPRLFSAVERLSQRGGGRSPSGERKKP